MWVAQQREHVSAPHGVGWGGLPGTRGSKVAALTGWLSAGCPRPAPLPPAFSQQDSLFPWQPGAKAELQVHVGLDSSPRESFLHIICMTARQEVRPAQSQGVEKQTAALCVTVKGCDHEGVIH